MSDWRKGAFDQQDDEPLGPLANLVDIMLVFACGLMAALVALSPELKQHFNIEKPLQVETRKELSQVPESLQNKIQQGDNSGLKSMGQVYRDEKTGKLILISQ